MSEKSQRAAIYDHREAYNSTLKNDDLEGWLDTLSNDCVFLPPNLPAVIGKDAVRGWAKEGFFDPFDIGFEFGYEDFEIRGDRAMGWGWFEQTFEPKAGGEEIHLKGKFIDVFKKAPDETWKLARCRFNTDHP